MLVYFVVTESPLAIKHQQCDLGFSDFVHVSVTGTSEDCPVYLSLCFISRCESVGWDRERPHAAGSQRSGESLPAHKPQTLPADGCFGGTQCACDDFR